MSTDTKGLLKGNVSHIEIIEFLKKKFGITEIDHSVKSGGVSEKVYDKIMYDGYIYFKYKEEQRSIFYISEHPKGKSYTEVDDGEYTYVSLGHNELAEEIIESIVAEFGGYYDRDDCDDEGFVPISKDGRFKPIRRVTMEEVYEKFGEVVIIEDR